jgi:hypothetical protein
VDDAGGPELEYRPMPEIRPYRSPLSEQELYELWMELKEQLPILYEKYCNPDYNRPDYEEELLSVNGRIGVFVDRSFLTSTFIQNDITFTRTC